jgi:hypothetical protein
MPDSPSVHTVLDVRFCHAVPAGELTLFVVRRRVRSPDCEDALAPIRLSDPEVTHKVGPAVRDWSSRRTGSVRVSG